MAAVPDLVLTLRSALHGEPATPCGEPWLAWLAIALCRQRARQDWLAEVARDRLDRREESHGRVPGMPEWSFDFHGRGLCLTGPRNEVLDVDLYADDRGPQTIDPYFFVTRVCLLTTRAPVERRLEVWSVLDESWCREELLEAAVEAEDRPRRRFIVGCLMHTADEETRSRAARLVPPPPDFTDARVGYTHEEVSFLNLREHLSFEREKAREVAWLIRPS